MRSHKFAILFMILLLTLSAGFAANAQGEPPDDQCEVLLFDDFDGDTLNAGLWSIFTNNNGTVNINGGILEIAGGTIVGGGISVFSNQFFTDLLFTTDTQVVILEVTAKISAADTSGDWGFRGDVFAGSDGGILMNFNPATGNFDTMAWQFDGDPVMRDPVPGNDPTEWHSYRFEVEIDAVRYYIDDVLVQEYAFIPPEDNPMHIQLNSFTQIAQGVTFVDFVQLSACEDLTVAKVDICHIPPDNPDNPRDISIDASAVPAHLAHGDILGACLASATQQ